MSMPISWYVQVVLVDTGLSKSRSWHVQIQAWHVQVQVMACPDPSPGMHVHAQILVCPLSRLSWLILACPGPVPGMPRLSWLILACPGLGPGMSKSRHSMSRSRSWHVQVQAMTCPGPGHGMSRSRSWHVQIQVLTCPCPDPGISRLSWLILACPGPVPGMSRLSWLILACPGPGPGISKSRHGMSRSRSWHVQVQFLACPDPVPVMSRSRSWPVQVVLVDTHGGSIYSKILRCNYIFHGTLNRYMSTNDVDLKCKHLKIINK